MSITLTAGSLRIVHEGCIELLKIVRNGIFEASGNRYSRSYLFSDVNYIITSEASVDI